MPKTQRGKAKGMLHDTWMARTRAVDFPAEYWKHLRTTNAIESTFSTVRLRTDKARGSRTACLTMVFKLMESASRNWRALNGLT